MRAGVLVLACGSDGGIKTFQFAVPADVAAEPRGPLCLRGGGYTVDAREGRRS